jgi:hypothetical protein
LQQANNLAAQNPDKLKELQGLFEDGRFGGHALLLMDGKPEFAYALSNQKELKYCVVSKEKLAAGKHTLKVDMKYEGPGYGKSATATLFVDGEQVAQGKIEYTIPVRFSPASIDGLRQAVCRTGEPTRPLTWAWTPARPSSRTT